MKWWLGAVVLLAIGLGFQLGLLVYAMYVLIGVLAVSRFFARQWTENLTAERECNRVSVQIGEKVAVVVTVKNHGRWSVPWLLLEDSLPQDALLQKPPRLKLDGRRLALVRVPARGQASLLYQITFQGRGYYQIGPLLMESGDLFGLHRRYRVVTEPHFVLVYPKVIPLEGYDLASRRPIGEVRITHRLFEDPTRISGVRGYQTGDPLNRIHWRATARTGVLHSKTYEPSSIAGATLLLDFHRSGYDPQGEPHRSDLAVVAAASLANALYQMGQQIGLISNGRDAADRIRQEGWRQEFQTRTAAQEQIGMVSRSDRLQPLVVPTRRGADQLVRILETLARLELTDGLTLWQLIHETASRMPRDATVVAILPDVSPEAAVALGNLRRRGFAVSAILTMYDGEDRYAEAHGRLFAERIDVRRVEDEAMIADLCARRAVSL